MSRKVVIALLSAVVIAGGLNAAPASAAKISNGTACSKLNATTTSSGYKYKCAKNTLVQNSKLTWLSVGCVDALTQYQSALKAQTDAVNVPELALQIDAALLDATASLETATAQYTQYRALLLKLQADMNAEKVASKKLSLSASVAKLSSAVLVLSASKSKLSSRVNDLKTQKASLETIPKQVKTAVSQSKLSATTLCKTGR